MWFERVIEYFATQSPVYSILAILIVSMTMMFRIWVNYKKEALDKTAEQQADRAAAILPGTVDNLDELLTQNFRVLNTYYSENLSQYRTSALASISIAVIGFIVIVAGILIAIIGDQIALGAMSAAAGIVSEAASMLFFRQNVVFQRQMGESQSMLVSMQYLMTSIALARELSADEKPSEIQRINEHLRQLMDGLHVRKATS